MQAETALDERVIGLGKRIHLECESPIERTFAASWASFPNAAGVMLRFIGAAHDADRIEPALGDLLAAERAMSREDSALFAIFPQVKLLGYRADFVAVGTTLDLFTSGFFVRAVVECDGFDFHERTKEQAARDRRRDREMLAAGWPVLRFLGSEFHASPFGPAFAVEAYLQGKVLEEKTRRRAEAA